MHPFPTPGKDVGPAGSKPFSREEIIPLNGNNNDTPRQGVLTEKPPLRRPADYIK